MERNTTMWRSIQRQSNPKVINLLRWNVDVKMFRF